MIFCRKSHRGEETTVLELKKLQNMNSEKGPVSILGVEEYLKQLQQKQK